MKLNFIGEKADEQEARSLALDALENMSWFDKALSRIDEVLPLAKQCLSNGSMEIRDDYDDFGCMGVAVGIGESAFYFTADGLDVFDVEEYAANRSMTQILADVVVGVLALLYDGEEFNIVEGEYVVAEMQFATARLAA